MRRSEVAAASPDGTYQEDGVVSYFRRQAALEELTPLPVALSGWGAQHMRGSAVTGALARSAETAGQKRTDLRPARFTADLQKAATMETVCTHSTIIREGGRLMLVDTELRQRDGVVARARTLFLPAAEQIDATPPWTSVTTPSFPPEHLRPETSEGRLFYSEDTGWDANAGRHRNSTRKQVWCHSIPIVTGELPTPFQATAVVSDLTNLVTHWGAKGVRHINADVTLVLAREPNGSGMGISATGRTGMGTLSVATAEIYDHHGVFGYTTVAALLHRDRAVDTYTHLMR
ncbi:thioesterase family protein [Rhodococcus sp. IEGM 1366]|uniref:acyl-CoA thioesterase domain-containing protein n=1 Tax=Rhodococcus sp. IEGM 1366 TaxID=3082223 RepID=UPI0029541828|nr:acyl-CoA thioesterase domain-containing protein [Rhodococcus sp. IEGM 1366]MDV8070920.1 thioesterase family protein [Rhodococcus sp. IEGM 1366]